MKTRRDKNRSEVVQWFRALCREAGLRTTPQRLEILQSIAGCTSHPTAEDVHKRLRSRMPTLSLDTVYRALDLFERHGILVRLCAPDGRSHFDPNRDPHHHLVCRECSRIEDFAWGALDALKPPPVVRKWGHVSRVQVEIHGLCAQCLRKRGRRAQGR